MTYQVLARKWRPKTFAELAGQAHVVQALTNALTRGRLHHAYLLTGTRGVGKTTIARILAKSLNCIANGVTATPCGTCAACLDIDAGRFVDLLELDAASNTGIDNMREILDNARYAPTVGRYKVYLIDEVHMLSKAAFNSMLKTLEEPPEHVRFVLATTDPQKIPVTVLSRCLQFNLKQLPVALIEERLASVLAAEEIAADPRALSLVARAAQGSMRDALSLLDQAIAYGGGEVREPAVRAMLGAVDTQHVYRLADALLASDGPALLAEVDALAARSIAPASALEELASLYHRIATVQAVPGAAQATDDGERVAAYAAAMTPEIVQLAYQICVQGRADLPLAPDEATGFAMTLLRLLAFAPGGGAQSPGPVAPAGRPAAAPAPHAAPGPAAAVPSGTAAVAPADAHSPAPSPAGARSPARSPAPAHSPAPSPAPARSPAPSPAPARSPAPSPAPAHSPAPSPAPAHSPAPSPAPARSPAPSPAPAHSPAPSPAAASVPINTVAEPVARLAAIPSRVATGVVNGTAAGSGAPLRALPRDPAAWPTFVSSLKLGGIAGQLAAQTQLLRCTDRELVLGLPEAQRHLTDKAYADKLKAALEEATGAKLRLAFELSSTADTSLAAQARRERAEQKARTEAQFRDEPFVRDVVARFDATVNPESIKPVS